MYSLVGNKIMLKRRSFLAYFSLAWLTSCFPIILAICAPRRTMAQARNQADENLDINSKVNAKAVVKKTSDGFTVIGSVSELKKSGYIQTKQAAVSIDPQNPKKLVAVNPKCTHQGCDVKWSTEEKKYECPCHNAKFDADGKVLNGPATKPLTTYPAKIVGTQVLVKI
jgi:cytochrome b6-f complex iron-sulfur subunit